MGAKSDSMTRDQSTADAFATSWNNLPSGSVYTSEQFEEWFLPCGPETVAGKTVLELGCGNGSLLVHMAGWKPSQLTGVDLGESVSSCRNNMAGTGFDKWNVEQGDLTTYTGKGFDFVYCIGVLHHLKDPKLGLDSVVRNTKNGGRFHCWVYAREGNLVIRLFVEPLRRVFSRFPWWFTKYAVATTLVFPYFLYAKFLTFFKKLTFLRFLPLYDYSLWIGKRNFAFHRHVAFDQLVTPQTVYIDKKTIESWLSSYGSIRPGSEYVIFRNGNSWKFGGEVQ